MSGVKSDTKSDEKQPLTRLIIPKETSEKKDDYNSLDSVLRWDKIFILIVVCLISFCNDNVQQSSTYYSSELSEKPVVLWKSTR